MQNGRKTVPVPKASSILLHLAVKELNFGKTLAERRTDGHRTLRSDNLCSTRPTWCQAHHRTLVWEHFCSDPRSFQCIPIQLRRSHHHQSAARLHSHL